MNLIPLRDAIYCVNCKQISNRSESRDRCIACQSVAILYLAGMLKETEEVCTHQGPI